MPFEGPRPAALQRSPGSRALWLPCVLFLFFLTLFWALRSNDYMNVDGALRALGPYFDKHLLFHGNNHLLYPMWISVWSRLAEVLGVRVNDAMDFIKVSQCMNGFFAAGSIALLYTVVDLFAPPLIALICTLSFGFSGALLLHATNSAEPVSGLFFSLLGFKVLIEGLRRNRAILLSCAGAGFAVALASYQSMGTIAGLVAFTCICFPHLRPAKFAPPPWRSLLSVFLGGLFAICIAYGWAYSRMGIAVSQMPHEFFSLVGNSGTYSGVSAPRIINIPFGLVQNWFSGAPPLYSGIRSLLHHPRRMFWLPETFAALIVAGIIAVAVVLAMRKLCRAWSPGLIASGVLAIACLVFPLVYWNPLYDKLWLLPLAFVTALSAASLAPGLLGHRSHAVLASAMLLVVGMELAINVPRAVRSHITPTPHLNDAIAVSRAVTPRDWIMLDFDPVSQLFIAFYAHAGADSNTLLLPSSTSSAAKAWLADAERAVAQDHARLFFVSVLDQDRKTWDDFLGRKVGIPYALLQECRPRATIVQTFPADTGVISLREYR